MSTQIKLILPLLDEDITKDDFTEKSGFVNGYIYNKNQPSLLSHLFLLYDAENRTYDKALTFEKLRKLKSLYSWKSMRIGGHSYILFTVNIISPKTKKLLKGIPSFEKDDVTKSLSFWNLKEDDVNCVLLGINPLLRIDNTSVPEEDYSFPDITTESGYKESLATRMQSGFFSVK